MEESRAQLIGRAKDLKAEIEQYFNDADHRNTAVRKPDEEAIDPDPNGELRTLLNGINGMLAEEAKRS